MIDIWKIGNTGVRNPLRIHEALRLYSKSALVGKIRGVAGAVAFTDYLCANGLLNNAPGKDPTGSYGRKWRLVFNLNGFTYDAIPKSSGVRQTEFGPVDEITQFGEAFLKADTVPAVQEFFLRASAMRMAGMPDGRNFSPLRWTLAVMLELERLTGASTVGFSEFAAYVQTSSPADAASDVAKAILAMRNDRIKASSKKKFDQAVFKEVGKEYPKKSSNFTDYGDMNLRYLRATGIVRSAGRGIEIVDEKHDVATLLAKEQFDERPLAERLRELYTCPPIPTDDAAMAREVLIGLERRIQKRGMAGGLDLTSLTTAAELNAARHKIEGLLANDEEIVYAHAQKEQWAEIADYMDLVIHRGGSKQYDDDTEIKVPKDEVSAYLEWIVWRAFLAMNTLANKPYEIRRFKIDQDFLPVGTAPGNGPDLIVEYDDCKIVIEVTMSDSSRQEAMEGEPVRRHVYDAVTSCSKPVYGLFVANNVNTNTIETFRTGTWYSKEDVLTRLDIVPVTLRQFRDYFISSFTNRREVRRNGEVANLIRDCVGMRDAGGAPEWRRRIAEEIAATTTLKNDDGHDEAWLSRADATKAPIPVPIAPEIIATVAEELKFREYLPIYSLRAACGHFGDGEPVECEGWVKAEGIGRLDETMAVVRAVGNSMEPMIHAGDLCVMRKVGGGDSDGKIVLVQRNDQSSDPESGGAYLLKKLVKEGDRRLLRSVNREYPDIPFFSGSDMSVVAYLHNVLHG